MTEFLNLLKCKQEILDYTLTFSVFFFSSDDANTTGRIKPISNSGNESVSLKPMSCGNIQSASSSPAQRGC